LPRGADLQPRTLFRIKNSMGAGMVFIEKLKQYRAGWLDVGLIKWSVLAAALLIAKLWTPILSLPWAVYLAVCIAAATRPVVNFLKTPIRK
jgi:hypothetical protein